MSCGKDLIRPTAVSSLIFIFGCSSWQPPSSSNFLLTQASAQEQADDNPEIIVLEKNQRAPWDGILLNKRAAADVIANAEITEKRCSERIKHEVDIVSIQKDSRIAELEAIHSAERQSCDVKVSARDERIVDLENKLIEKSDDDSTFWIVLGTAGGFVLGAAATIAASAAVVGASD